MFSSCRCSTTLPSSPLLPNLHFINRRSLLLLSTTTTTTLSLSSPLSAAPPPPPDTTITDRIFMDFSICPTYFQNRTLGDELSQCADSEPLGRLVLGLYGNLVPLTVSNFKSMCTGSSGSSYRGTLVHKLFPGQFFVAGRQGRRDKGEVKPPTDLVRNTESIDSRAFLLGHSGAGVVSLCLSENDDDDEIKLDPNYRNVEFLITTGPGPCPQLDNKNIVFGTVLEGLDVVTTIASIPTYRPGERIRQYNDLAQFLGDERAKTARAIWNKPLKTVYISDCGELKNGRILTLSGKAGEVTVIIQITGKVPVFVRNLWSGKCVVLYGCGMVSMQSLCEFGMVKAHNIKWRPKTFNRTMSHTIWA